MESSYGKEINDSDQIISITQKNVNESSKANELAQANNALEDIEKPMISSGI